MAVSPRPLSNKWIWLSKDYPKILNNSSHSLKCGIMKDIFLSFKTEGNNFQSSI